MQEDQTTAAALEERFTALLGYGWKRDLAECIGLTLPRLSEQFTQNRVRPVIVGHLEWLEATPINKWPERWHKLAARAKAAQKKKDKAA